MEHEAIGIDQGHAGPSARLSAIPAEAGLPAGRRDFCHHDRPELRLGEVQVRKDLGAVSGTGRPKVGYNALQLMAELESCLNGQERCVAVIVGAGRLGRALLDYEGFGNYGVSILGAFDRDEEKLGFSAKGKPILPMTELEAFLQEQHVRVGVVTVGEDSAQEVCDRLVQGGVEAIWSFAPGRVELPQGVMLKQEIWRCRWPI